MKMKDTNELKISGHVVNKYETKQFVKLGIATSETRRGETVTNYPTVYFFRDENGKTPADDVMMHDGVTLYGHMSSSMASRRHRDTYRMQQIVGDSLEPIETVYPNALEGRRGKKIELEANVVRINGEVTQVSVASPNVVNVYIDAVHEGVHNIINVTCFGRIGSAAEPGRRAEIIAYISTSRKKQADGKYRYYQNVVARSITVPVSQTAEKEA